MTLRLDTVFLPFCMDTTLLSTSRQDQAVAAASGRGSGSRLGDPTDGGDRWITGVDVLLFSVDLDNNLTLS